MAPDYVTSENFLITIKTLLFDMVLKTSEKKERGIQTRHNECVVEKRKIIKLAFNNSSWGFISSHLNSFISMDMVKFCILKFMLYFLANVLVKPSKNY